MLRLSSLSCSGILLSIILAFPLGSRNVIPSQAKAILENADRFEVLSLDPHYRSEKSDDDFYGYTVLRRVVVTSSETRKALVSAFERAVEENQDVMGACFIPRHGLRASNGDKYEDFVICFQCLQVEAHGDVERDFLISKSAATVFDGVLQQSRQRSDSGIPSK